MEYGVSPVGGEWIRMARISVAWWLSLKVFSNGQRRNTKLVCGLVTVAAVCELEYLLNWTHSLRHFFIL